MSRSWELTSDALRCLQQLVHSFPAAERATSTDSWDGIIHLKNTEEHCEEISDDESPSYKFSCLSNESGLFGLLDRLKTQYADNWSQLAFVEDSTVSGQLSDDFQQQLNEAKTPTVQLITDIAAYILDRIPEMKAIMLWDGGVQLWFFLSHKIILITLAEELNAAQLACLLKFSNIGIGFRGKEVYANLWTFRPMSILQPEISLLIYPYLEQPWNCFTTTVPVLHNNAWKEAVIRWAWEFTKEKSPEGRYAVLVRLPCVNQLLVAFYRHPKVQWLGWFRQPVEMAMLKIVDSELRDVSMNPAC